MKIEHLRLESLDPHVHSATLDLSTCLNVVETRHAASYEHLADLVGHVLYGARLNREQRVVYDCPGYVDVASTLGRFRLQRHHDRANRGDYTEPRLTVTALNGQSARSTTARDLLGGMSPEIAARLLILRSATDSQLEWLLSESLAAELCRLEQSRRPAADRPPLDSAADELFSRRDRLSREIETLLSDKRRTSETLEAAIAELAQETQSAEQRLDERRRELEGVLSQLGELETQLRYQELADFVSRTSDDAHHADQQPALAGLDDEIAKWRRALADLESRESAVRRQLAQMHPDDASPWLPLADQRACVAIAQRLVADLDSEVARYARPGDSTACLCKHTHARLHPLVDTLGEQIEKLARLVEQYESAVEIEQLKAEAQHLARSQAELRGTIDHLLDRRQSRLRTSRAREARQATGPGLPANWQQQQAELVHRQGELKSLVEELERRVAELHARGEQLRRDRAELMNDAQLSTLRQQLDETTRQLEQGKLGPSSATGSAAPWRASDILAKLTDGRLREVRLTSGGRHATVSNRQGASIAQRDLNDVDRRLLAISLQLAAVAGASQWGFDLPLIVADPFAQLPAAESSILALVLHDFAQSGHQVLIVTTSTTVVERLRAVGQAILSLEQPNGPTCVEATVLEESPAPRAQKITLHQADTFALQRDDAVERFSVFGDETAQAFSAIGIHTIGDLLDADAPAVARALDRTSVTRPIVELWQIHVAMLTYVPNLTLQDARVLTGAGVYNLEQLADTDADHLYHSACDYLDSPRGARHRSLRRGLSREQFANWISDTRRHREHWQGTRYANCQPPRNSVKHVNSHAGRRRRNGVAKRSNPQPSEPSRRPLKFRLSLASPVVDAPSIGPKTARRLAKIGVTTVADLLGADAAQTADKLGLKHVSAETIVEWQHQSQLMCRIPELLARDTQVLVGCGFTTAEDIAAAKAADLLEFAKSYTATPEGSRVLRGADPPDLARVKKWVFWAGHRRALEAA